MPGRKRAALRRRLGRLLGRERALWAEGCCHVAGVDEVGMGPLAGPIVAAAVIFPAQQGIAGVDDSKKLEAAVRERLAGEIRSRALAYSLVRVEPDEIDRLNVYRAGLEAMRRAILQLDVVPEVVLVDGRQIPGLELRQEKWIHGDARCHVIAAASILAKTARDAWMTDYDREYPGYGFAEHKGYSTAAHRDAVRRLGPCPIHRRSFALPQPTLWDAPEELGKELERGL